MDFLQRLSQVLPSETSQWTSMDFQLFLKFIHLDEYGPQFKQYNINAITFLQLSDEDLQDMGISNLIARTKLLEKQALLRQYDTFLTDQRSIEMSKGEGFFENSISQPSKNDNFYNSTIQNSIQNSVAFDPFQQSITNNNDNNEKKAEGFFGGGFGNIDFFNSGTFDSKKIQEEHAAAGSIYTPANQEKQETAPGEMEILVSHYHIKPYLKDNKQANNGANRNKRVDEGDDEIEYVYSEIVPREEIEKKKMGGGFSYFNKKDMKSKLLYNPTSNELKLMHLNTEGKSFSIKDKPFLIGRENKEASLQLISPEISHLNTEILLHNNRFFLRDLKSKYGTWIKVLPEKPYPLQMPSQIEIGGTKLLLTYKSGILAVKNAQTEKSVPLQEGKDVITIGKIAGCTISFPEDVCLSKIHCKIYAQENKILIEDCKSLNGTWARVQEDEMVLMEEGMEFRVGHREEKFKVMSIYLKNEENQTARKCVKCLKFDINTVLEPCRHVALCEHCARELRICPECKTDIEKIIVTM